MGTLEDLKRVSSKRLPGLSEMERQTSLKMLQEAAKGSNNDNLNESSMGKPFGALPVTDGTIDIANFNKGGAGDDESCTHMSYIYGDEDSQHHKLPDYSISHRTPNFEPKMPKLEEEDGGDDAMDTDEDFDDIGDDDDEAVEIDGLKGNTTKGSVGMASLSINVVPAGKPQMQ